ncbi:peptidoglycan-associated lipoprotein Pal [Lampropedia puyangensis]|uniref:Peptidoglycan-associated lipoprotein n=1 Tax=Lampropedia puyangensis TaxID=1330072 RepID=A0A4S8FA92_9BURK|nr:peptidoglycan-associated lipoprotein Pal [Lampropedia puyangensis]THU04508.1 peptidoglycan-associated lipoprotein Pal [Lampropedia puyangensis]
MLSLKQSLSYSVLAAAVALAGCSSKTKLDDQANSGTGTAAYDASGQGQSSISGVDLSISPIEGEGPVNVAHTIYFDFDSYSVKPEYQATLQKHADFMRANRNITVTLEGHTDERGGREYNLALGQRRAEAVRQTLDLLGVPASQLEAISYGKEKPKATGFSEEAFSQNRRVEIRYNK